MGVVQKQLSNGVKVNMVSMGDEPQRAAVRLYVPGRLVHAVEHW